MKIRYLDLKNDFHLHQTIVDNRIVSIQKKGDYHLNKSLIPLFSSDSEKVLISYLSAVIIKISSNDYKNYIENFSHRKFFPQPLLDLNIILNKNSYIDKDLHNPPVGLFKKLLLNLTPNCNLRCKYCYASSGRRPEKANMPLKLAKKAIDYVSQYCQGELYLGFVGEGEPTFDFKLIKQVVSYAKKKIKTVIVDPLSTNGVVSQEVADWLVNNVDNLQISCDGPAFIQNKYRPLLGEKGSSVFVEKTIKYLKKQNKDFRVRATVVDDTFGNEKQIVNYFMNLGVKRLFFGPLENVGEAESMVLKPNFKQNKAYNQKEYFLEFLKLTELVDEVENEKYTPSLLNIGTQVSCGIYSKAIFVVDPFGNVSSCTRHTGPSDFIKYPFMKDLIIGQYNSDKEKFEINFKKLESLKETIDKERRVNHCESCSLSSICGTVCLYRIGLGLGSISSDNSNCSITDKQFQTLVFKYLAKKYLVNKKPCLELKNGKLYYALFYNRFRLHLQKAEDKMKYNPYIYINNLKNLNQLSKRIIEYKKSKKLLVLFLLKFSFKKDYLNNDSGKKIINFFEELEKNNVYFRISKPLPKTILGREYDKVCEQFRLPKQYKDCLELYIKKDDQIIFPDGTKGRKKFNDYKDREEICQDLKRD